LPFVSWHQGDVEDINSLPWRSRFTHAIHAATDSTNGPLLTPAQRFDQIVSGTRNILELSKRTGVSRFLLTSSGAVYGEPKTTRTGFDEQDWLQVNPLQDANAYAIGKIAAEQLCSFYKGYFEPVIARCFAFVGPDLPLQHHFAIGNFIHDALNSDRIAIYGDGTAIRSYMDQRDLAQWLVTLLMRGGSGEAFNVGSNQAISMLELAKTVRDVLAPNKEIDILAQNNTTQARRWYVPNIEKAKQTLGLGISVPLKDAIQHCADEQGTGDSV
jgi:dTDP-glucose 4,6-dehydratase